MATQHIVTLVDDTDGSDAAETVKFAYENTNYEIDLSTVNAASLREALAPFVAHARELSGKTSQVPRMRSGEPAKIRAWAEGNGIQVNKMGRIPRDIVAQYRAR